MTDKKVNTGYKTMIVWGWVLLAILPICIVLYGLLNAIFSTGMSPDSLSSSIIVIFNTLLLLVSLIGFFCLPLGIVLLIIGYVKKSKISKK